jgi:hypothetical protein
LRQITLKLEKATSSALALNETTDFLSKLQIKIINLSKFTRDNLKNQRLLIINVKITTLRGAADKLKSYIEEYIHSETQSNFKPT